MPEAILVLVGSDLLSLVKIDYLRLVKLSKQGAGRQVQL
jgi:hypothetical protein